MYAPKSTLGTIAEVGGGLLGEYLTGKKAKKAEEDYDTAMTEGAIRASQQIGADGLPVSQPAQGFMSQGRMGKGLEAAGFPATGAPPAGTMTGGPEAATAPAPFQEKGGGLAEELAGADLGIEALDALALYEGDRGRALDDNQMREFLHTGKVKTPDSPEAPPAPPRNQDELAAYLGIGSGQNPTVMPEPAAPQPVKMNIAGLSPEQNQRLGQAVAALETQNLPPAEFEKKFKEAMAAEMMQGAPPEAVAQAQAAGTTSLPVPGAADPLAGIQAAAPAPPAEPSGAATDINAMLGMAPQGGGGGAPMAGPEGTVPNEQALRAYLGLIGEEGATGLIGKAPHVSSKSILSDKSIVLHMSDGSMRHTGRKAIHDGTNYRDDLTGEIINVSGGVASKVTEGQPDTTTDPNTLQPNQPQPPAPPAAQTQAPAVTPSAPAVAGGPTPSMTDGVSAPMTGGPPVPPTPAATTGAAPIRMSTAAQVEFAKKNAQITAELGQAEGLAWAAGTKAAAEAEAKGDIEFRQFARDALPKMDMGLDRLNKDIPALVNHPGLPVIVGKGVWAKLGNVPFKDLVHDIGLSNTAAADALARLEQMKGQVFLPAFEYIKGGGQVTNLEGDKAQNAMARMSRAQTVEAFTEGMRDFHQAYIDARQKRWEIAQGKYDLRQFRPGGEKSGAIAPVTNPLDKPPAPPVSDAEFEDAMKLFGG
jgi:hypothetical protein